MVPQFMGQSEGEVRSSQLLIDENTRGRAGIPQVEPPKVGEEGPLLHQAAAAGRQIQEAPNDRILRAHGRDLSSGGSAGSNSGAALYLYDGALGSGSPSGA